MFEIFYLFNSRYIKESVFNLNGLLGNRYVLIAVSVLIVFPELFYIPGPNAGIVRHDGHRSYDVDTHRLGCILGFVPC